MRVMAWNMLHILKMLWMLWNTLTLLTIDLLQKAEAELAYELQAAKTKQRIKEENMQIKVNTALLTKETEIKMNPVLLIRKIMFPSFLR